jgi:hypothetical protein
MVSQCRKLETKPAWTTKPSLLARGRSSSPLEKSYYPQNGPSSKGVQGFSPVGWQLQQPSPLKLQAPLREETVQVLKVRFQAAPLKAHIVVAICELTQPVSPGCCSGTCHPGLGGCRQKIRQKGRQTGRRSAVYVHKWLLELLCLPLHLKAGSCEPLHLSHRRAAAPDPSPPSHSPHTQVTPTCLTGVGTHR